MEEPFRSRVLDCIFSISQITEVSAPLLSFLLQEKALIQDDVEIINSLPTRFEKADKLYQTLLRRPRSYEPLIAALEVTNQHGVIEILGRSGSTSPTAMVESEADSISFTLPQDHEIRQSPSPPTVPAIITSPSPPSPPYPVEDRCEGETLCMPVPPPEYRCPPNTPTSPPSGPSPEPEPDCCRSRHGSGDELEAELGPKATLHMLHKYLFRSHVRGKPLIIVHQTPSKLEELHLLCQAYVDEYHSHYDHNILRMNSDLPRGFFKAAKKYGIDQKLSKTVGFNLDPPEDIDLKTVARHIYKHFSQCEKKALLILENVDASDKYLPKVLPPPTSNPEDYPAIVITSAKREGWGLDANLVDLTADGMLVKKSMFLGSVVGPVFQSAIETFNFAKTRTFLGDGIIMPSNTKSINK